MSGIPHKQIEKRGWDITALYPEKSSDLINQFNYFHHQQIFEKNPNTVKPNYWNRFTIIKHPNCKHQYSQNFLLYLITKFVSPSDILPLYVVKKSDKLFFVAKNCFESMKKLCQAELSLPNPVEPEYPFTIIIIKHFTSINSLPVVNVDNNIRKVLIKRHVHGSLDLTKFHEDKDLEEFCPLFQPKVLLYILSLATEYKTVLKIVLCNNDIRKLPNFGSLDYRDFKAIDLGSNMIEKIEDILPLKHLPQLRWLRLDDNPLCGCFDDGHTYFLYVKTICKELESLDTKMLCEDGWFKKHKTFLCSEKGYDFASQFITKYYTYFDNWFSKDIGRFYHKDAMFSLTHTFYRAYPLFPAPPSWLYPNEHNNKLNFFYKGDRNLLKGRDDSCLIIGPSAIEFMFETYFPPIKHNPGTLCVDLMYYTKKIAIITVSGVFEDARSLKALGRFRTTFGFLRTFALTSSDGEEWLITNDQWNIYSPFTPRNTLPPMPKKKKIMCTFPEPNLNKTQELHALTQTFQGITEMSYEHSKKFLLGHGWSLELALKDFMDKHINDEIPDDAFEKISCTRENKDSSDDEVIIFENYMLPSITKLLEDLAPSAPEAPSCSNYSKTENDK